MRGGCISDGGVGRLIARQMKRFFKQIKRLGRELERFAGVEATIYRRGAVVWDGEAFQGSTVVESINDAGVKIASRVVDWLLRPDGSYLPEPEDVLIVNSDGARYIVRPVGSEVWKFDDPARDVVRVHTMVEK